MPNILNKIIYDGNTLIDLSADTVEQAYVLEGYSFHDKNGNILTGSCEYDADTSDADAISSEILATKTAYVNGTKITGSMNNRGSWADTIDDLNDSISIPVGFHDGGGSVSLDATEKGKVIASNIKKGVTLFGVEGSYEGEAISVEANKNATPSSSQQVITPSAGYDYLAQVTVAAIPYEETLTAGTTGYTATIG